MTSIGVKLTRIQTTGALLFLIVSIMAIWTIEMSRAGSALHQRELARLASVEEVADLLAENRIAEAYLIFDDSPANRRLLATRNRQLNEELGILKTLSPPGAVQAGIARLEATWRGYLVQQRQLTGLVTSRRSPQAIEMFSQALETRFGEVDRMADALVGEVEDEAHAAAVEAQRVANILTVIAVLVSGFGILLALLMLYFVRRKIVGPLAQITRSLSDLAAGDVDVHVTGGERGDEIGAMVRALEVFRGHASRLEQAHRETQDAQANAEALARHDALTGLPNRRLFVEALGRATHTQEMPCAVFLIDLDRFKPINDVYGHEAGDAVLCALADRFAAHRDELGTIARLGGDEFAFLLPIASGPEKAVRAAELIGKLVARPIPLDGMFVEVGATIGIALFPQDGSDPPTLLRAADLAMYQAKSDKVLQYRFFEPAMHQEVQDRALLDADLRRAIAADEIRPHYQPLVSIENGELVGFEILSRWHHPTRGIIMPDMFIQAADERGLLTQLTYRVLRHACADAQEWPHHLRLSLNLSPSQLRDALLAPRILAILNQTGISPGRIEIEVTENALITDLEATKTVLASLQNLGMTIALDDFGTGYSSLYHLRDLKFDKIKIDKSFVEALEAGGEGAKIVHAMIGLGKSLGLTTTAEGIEDAGQWSSLSKWGCDFGQGFLFGKAMTAEQAGIFLGLTVKPQARTKNGWSKSADARRRAS